MRQSKLFSKTERKSPKDEVSLNAQLLVRAGFINKLAAGIYSFLPLGLKVLRRIEAVVREEMNALGGEEILMPALHPKYNWEKTGRWDSYDTLFRFTSHYSKTAYVIGPTHEEIVSPLMKYYISSYKDLPRYVYQFQNKYRDEKRVKSGLLRGREFMMKDLYSFHGDDNDLDEFYEKVIISYKNIFSSCGLEDKTYLTYASGGSFSKYSHEFQAQADSGEDLIFICQSCNSAVNKEIKSEHSRCPSCDSGDFRKAKSVEIGNIFKLKTKYSSPFTFQYKDENGKQHDVVMGCYGIGLTRLVGTIVEIHHDQQGIIWPENVAPFKVHLLQINEAEGDQIYRKLQRLGIDVLFDDRPVSAGQKLNDADLIGIPWRVIISPQTKGRLEIKRRNSQQLNIVDADELIKLIHKK